MNTTKRFVILFVMMAFIAQIIHAQPTANFTSNNTSGCVPLLVQYQDLSQGAIVSWSWNLGTTTSGLQNPVQLYTTGATHTICLTVTDTAGLTDTKCVTNYIDAYALPDVNFSANPTIGCNPALIQFTDNSTTPSGAAITSWQWSFGDGGSSNAQNPSHTYNQTNTFDVTLAVVDANGCSRSTTQTSFVSVVDPPSASFTATNTSNCNVPHTVFFTNTTPNTGALSFLWDFGDTSTSNAFSPAHTYTSSGIYTVSLTVTDINTGCSDVFTSTSLVDLTSKLAFSHNLNQGCGPTAISFSDNTPGTTSNWIWDFGNGDSSFVQNPTYTYTTPGCYMVSFTATDQDGCISTITDTNCINIYDIPTVSYVSSGNLQGCSLPHTMSFNGGSSNAILYVWDFGDGTVDSTQNPTHTYTSYGTFPVTLTVTSPDGCTNSITTDTIVLQPIIANFSTGSVQGCTPLTVNFTDLSTSLFPINSWEWSVGDSTSSVPNPSVTLTDTGTHNVQLIVSNTGGCADTLLQNNLIGVGIPPNLSFVSDTVTCVSDSVLFNNTSDAFPQSWSWLFGDGSSSSAINPIHQYQDTGVYTVSLTASHFNCTNNILLTNYIEVFPPEAIFTHQVVCDTPYLVHFSDASVAANNWQWDFGDPTTSADTSSAINPSYTYPSRGDYIVTLTVFNGSSGCSHTLQRTVQIRDPQAGFTVAEDTICADNNLTIVNTSIGASSHSWTAQGANISNANSSIPNISYSQGYYDNIQLIITDVNGCQDTLINTDTINVSDVTVAFTENITTGCVPLAVNFNESSTTFLGTLTNWSWNFNDGIGSSMIQNPTYTYNDTGSYSPVLTVTNSLGCVRSLTGNLINPSFPTADFTADTVACTGQLITFNNLSTGEGISYSWDFGDGNISTLENPTHVYNSEDTFTVCLTVTDLNGCDTTICKNNYIRIANPLAGFTADTTNGRCGTLTVTFQDTSLNAVSREWIFSDGTTSNLVNPVKTFSAGTYDVALVATNASGCTDTIQQLGYIVVTEPIADFSFTPNSGCPPLDVTFTATATGVYRYIWVTGDGGLVEQVGTGGSDTMTLNYAYQHGGSYFPVLIAESDSGCQDINIAQSTIDVEVFEVEIDASDTLLCDNGTITFTSMMTSPLPIDTISWTFSGGSISQSNDSIVDVTFSNVGIYTVTLYSGNGTCSRSTTRTIQVVPSPNSSFTSAPSLMCHPQPVNFTNNSGISAGSIISQQWTYGTYGSDTTLNGNFTFPQPDTVGVELITVSDFGCADTTSNTIIINETPTANAGQDFTVCRGEVATLNGSGNGTYQWSPASAVTCPTCPDPIVVIDSATQFILTVASPEGCVDRDTVNVDLSPFSTPVIDVSNDTTICLGDTIQLFATGGQDVLGYTWDNTRAGLSCYNSCSNPFASPTVTTTYPVVYEGQGGCLSRDSVTVTVILPNTNILGADMTICEGDTVSLQTSMGMNHQWLPYEGLSCVFCDNPQAFPLQSTSYSVIVETQEGCVITDSIQINVIPKNSISAGADQTICTNGSIQLNGVGVGLISWDNAATLSDASILNPIATPTQTTEYILSIQTNGCTLTDTTTVFVLPNALIQGQDIEVCAGETIQIELDAFAQSFLWTPAIGLSDSSAQNPLLTLQESTTYSVLAEIPGCPSSTAEVAVTVNEVPEINSFEFQEIITGTNAPIAIEVQANPTYTYQWSPNIDISCIDCPNPTIQGNTDGLTYVLSVTDLNGCTATDFVTIKLLEGCDERQVIVPNAFTPNGDGLNDVLYVRGSSIQDIQAFRIYGRNGEQVFFSDDKSIGWDGTFNGREVDTGVYVYFVEAICPLDGRVILKKGNVTLFR